MIKLVKKSEWEQMKDTVEKLEKKVEVLEFQRDNKYNVALTTMSIGYGLKQTIVEYVDNYNDLKSLALPTSAYKYKLDKEQIVALDIYNNETARYKINTLDNVLVEIPVKVKRR